MKLPNCSENLMKSGEKSISKIGSSLYSLWIFIWKLHLHFFFKVKFSTKLHYSVILNARKNYRILGQCLLHYYVKTVFTGPPNTLTNWFFLIDVFQGGRLQSWFSFSYKFKSSTIAFIYLFVWEKLSRLGV